MTVQDIIDSYIKEGREIMQILLLKSIDTQKKL